MASIDEWIDLLASRIGLPDNGGMLIADGKVYHIIKTPGVSDGWTIFSSAPFKPQITEVMSSWRDVLKMLCIGANKVLFLPILYQDGDSVIRPDKVESMEERP